MATKDRVIDMRQKYPDMYPSEIARRTGFTRQYISLILKKAGLPSSHPFKGRHTCKDCGKPLDWNGRRGEKRCRQCFKVSKKVYLTCTACGSDFSILKSDYSQRSAKRKIEGWFCCRPCFGVYAGKHYGWPAHKNARKTKRQQV